MQQPLEVTDFSGGMTENILNADPRRYQYADNFFITVDRQLEERYPFLPISLTAYQIPNGEGQRVNGIYAFINETILMAQSGRNLAVFSRLPDAWTSIPGFEGNQPIQGGDIYSQNTYAEFQRQIYMTNDGLLGVQQGTLPNKIYRDETNNWVSLTAGLPRSYVDGTTDNVLLSKCITNANLLRASFVAHMLDSLNTTVFVTPGLSSTSNITLHNNVDWASLSYFQTVTYPTNYPPTKIISPAPTPAPAANDQASLFTLISALNSAYSLHMPDAMIFSYGVGSDVVFPNYHQNISIAQLDTPSILHPPKGPGVNLSSSGTPKTLIQAAGMLDDLAQKWNWHRKAIYTHSPLNDPIQFDRYNPNVTKIGTIHQGNTFATITPDYSDIYTYINNLRAGYNAHVSNNFPFIVNGQHAVKDNANDNFQLKVLLPEVSNLDDSFLMIYWLRSQYQMHYLDASVKSRVTFTMTTTAGSPNVTAVIRIDTNSAYQIPVGSYVAFLPTGNVVQARNNWDDGAATPNYRVAKVTASASGTATFDRNIIASGTLVTGQSSVAHYHVANNAASSGFQNSTTTSQESTVDALSNPSNSVGVNLISWLDLAEDFYNAIFQHAAQSVTHFPGSLFTAAIGQNLFGMPYTPFLIPVVPEYGYAFYWKHTYTVEPNGIEYTVKSNPVLSDIIEAAQSYPIGYIPISDNGFWTPGSVTAQVGNQLTNLPVLKNTPDTNYATDKVKLVIARTTDGGNTYYDLVELDNGTTSYLDLINDNNADSNGDALTDGNILYTSGGVVGSDQPPQSKFIHILDGTTYYGGITDTGQFFPNRLLQAVQFAPDWAPATFTDDMPDEITGISSARQNLIVLCKNSIYRESGSFTSSGQGALTHESISDAMGCDSAKSILRTEIGVFFAGTDGFYYTDAFQIIKISLDQDKTYAALTASAEQRRAIHGCYDKDTRRIWWSMKQNPTDAECSISYVFYLDYGVKPSGVFTRMNNGLNYQPASMVFLQGVPYLGHGKGAILFGDKWNKSDAVVDMTVTPDQWNTVQIPYNYVSSSINMGSTFQRKYITKIHIVGDNVGNATVSPIIIKDLNQTQIGGQKMAPVNYVNNMWWGNPTCIWGDPNFKWEYDGKLDVWRRIPAQSLRSDFVQIQMKPPYIAVYASSIDFPEFSGAMVDATLKTIEITTPSGFTKIKWPFDVVGYKIKFPWDDYTMEYLITAINEDKTVLTVSDPNNTLITTTTAIAWEIWGFKKQQKFKLASYVMHYSYLGDQNQNYPGSASNSGPGNAGENPS